MWGKRLQLTVLCYMLVILLFLVAVYMCDEPGIVVEDDEKIQGTISPMETYLRLFEQKRAMQVDAVKSIFRLSKYEQRYKLIDQMVEQIFEILQGCKQNLTDLGYIPGDPFHADETLNEEVSKVLESVSMFGELVLRHPDITHAIYGRKKEWEFLIGWAVWFSMESNVFQGSSQKMLNLMGQELGLTPKDENYVNPYKESAHMQEDDPHDKEDTKKVKKSNKKPKEKKKGPKLSGTKHTEL